MTNDVVLSPEEWKQYKEYQLQKEAEQAERKRKEEEAAEEAERKRLDEELKRRDPIGWQLAQKQRAEEEKRRRERREAYERSMAALEVASQKREAWEKTFATESVQDVVKEIYEASKDENYFLHRFGHWRAVEDLDLHSLWIRRIVDAVKRSRK